MRSRRCRHFFQANVKASNQLLLHQIYKNNALTHDSFNKCVYADIQTTYVEKNTDEIKQLAKYGYNWEFPFKDTKKFLLKQKIVKDTLPESSPILSLDTSVNDSKFSFVEKPKDIKYKFSNMQTSYHEEMLIKKKKISSTEPFKMPPFDPKINKQKEDKSNSLPKLSLEQLEHAFNSILSTNSLISQSANDATTDQDFNHQSNFEDEDLETRLELLCSNRKIEETLGVLDKTWSGQAYQPYNPRSKLLYVGSYAGIDGVVTLNYLRALQQTICNDMGHIRESIEALSHMYSLKMLMNMAVQKKKSTSYRSEEKSRSMKISEDVIDQVLKTIDIALMENDTNDQ